VEATEVRRVALHLAQDSASCRIPTLFRDTGRYYLADDAAHAFNAARFYEMHLNSGVSTAHGVETLVGPNASAKEKAIAADMSAAIARTLGIPNRGVKVRDDLAVLHQYKDMASFIIEIVFVSNKGDMSEFRAHADALELAIFNVHRKHYGLKPMTKLPRLTWRKVRIPKYLKTT